MLFRSMVYGFAKQSGGHVRIYSEVGKGTTVKLYLSGYFGSAVEVDERACEPAKLAKALRSETVLVVEDDDLVRQMGCEALRELGYVVHEAASGKVRRHSARSSASMCCSPTWSWRACRDASSRKIGRAHV